MRYSGSGNLSAAPFGRAGLVLVLAVAWLPGAALPAAAQDGVSVSTEDELRDHYADTAVTKITLENDISLVLCEEGDLERHGGEAAVTIDGGGFTITQTCTNPTGLNNLSVFFHDSPGAFTVQDITLTGGKTLGVGGAILAPPGAGNVTVTRSTIVGNQAVGGGGAIGATAGHLTVEDSEFSNNDGDGSGGAVAAASMEIRRSTFMDNHSGAFGGAIFTYPGTDSVVLVENSTVVGNSASAGGGGLAADQNRVRLVHSTVSNNDAPSGGNATALQGGALEMFGSVLAEAGAGGNCSVSDGGAVFSDGYNFADDESCGFTAEGDIQGGDPRLGDLADNGGPTPTLMPMADSPLIDAIPESACLESVATDQRGDPRPQGDGCDIGAVETEAPNAAPVADDVEISTTDGQAVSFTATATDPDGDPVTFRLESAPAHGTAAVAADGSATYTPDARFTGTDTFTIVASDDRGGTDTLTVTIMVTPARLFDAHATGLRALAIGPLPYSEVRCATGPESDADDVPALAVPGVVSVGGLSTSASGGRDGEQSRSTATARLEIIDLLGGTVHIQGAAADAEATSTAGGEVDAPGEASFLRIRINGEEISPDVAPNTTINLGVAKLTLNGQKRTATGITVTAVQLNLVLLGETVVIGRAAAHLPDADGSCRS